MLPLPVLEKARDEMLSLAGTGMSVMEISHRSKHFGRILDGEPPPPPSAVRIPFRPRPATSAVLWTRLTLGDGIELHLDTRRVNPTGEQLIALRESVRAILGTELKE